MSNFSRKNLNNIKHICSEKTGATLTETRPMSPVKIMGAVLAVILVLTPLTAYGTRYTMDFLEYRESEKNVKAEASVFVEDFFDFAYGKSDTYRDDDGVENSFCDFIRQSVYLFRDDIYLRDSYIVGYSWWSEVDTNAYIVGNDGNIWYLTVNAEVSETRNQRVYSDAENSQSEEYTVQPVVFDEYSVKFYLKYEGSGEHFVLTDMYFYDSKGYSETVFGDIGVLGSTLDTAHFKAWAENTNDYSEYIDRIHVESVAYDRAKVAAEKFLRDYISYVHGTEEPFADRDGQIYALISTIKGYMNVTRDYEVEFKYDENINAHVSRLAKVGDYWYAQCGAAGGILKSDGTHVADYWCDLFLKFNETDGEYDFEDFYISGTSDGFKIFNTSDTPLGSMEFADFEGFIEWADSTNDYSDYIYKGYVKINDYVGNNKVKNDALTLAETFLDAAFCDGENVWDNGSEDELTVFISEFVDYFKLSIKKDSVLKYEPQSLISALSCEENAWYVSVRSDITEYGNDGSEFTYMTKFFFKYELKGAKLVLTDFYYYGNLPQCKEVFEKVGKNNYSLTDSTFIEWADTHDDYSYYTDKVLAAVANLGK